MQSLRWIKYTSAPGGATVTYMLADSKGKNLLLVDYQLTHQDSVQVVQRPRAISPDVYHRGNLLYVARFTVRRHFTSVGAVHTFKHRHAWEVAGRGTFTSQIGGTNGSMMSAENWALSVLGMEDQGVGLLISYQAMGPKPDALGVGFV